MEDKILEVVEFYEQKEVDRLVKMTRFVTHQIEVALRKKQILARVAATVKSLGSLKTKLQKWSNRKNDQNW